MVQPVEGRPSQADLEAVQRWGEEHPAAFGGMWLEPDEGAPGRSRLVVALVGGDTVGGDSALRDSLRRLVAEPAALRFVEHRWTLRELQALHEAVAERVFSLRSDDGSGARASGLGVDVVTNCLRVTLSAPSTALEREVLALAPGRIEVAGSYGEWRAY